MEGGGKDEDGRQKKTRSLMKMRGGRGGGEKYAKQQEAKSCKYDYDIVSHAVQAKHVSVLSVVYDDASLHHHQSAP